MKVLGPEGSGQFELELEISHLQVQTHRELPEIGNYIVSPLQQISTGMQLSAHAGANLRYQLLDHVSDVSAMIRKPILIDTRESLRDVQLLLIDPPWPYKDKASAGGRGAACKYPTMTKKQISEMPLQYIMAPNSVVVMWATFPLLFAQRTKKGNRVKDDLTVEEIMSAWGFQYKTALFVWLKLTQSGTFKKGMGHYSRSNAEVCFLGVRGKGLPVLDHSIGQVIASTPQRPHSTKPDEARERLEKLFGEVNRLEMFARTERPGWNLWGNDAPNCAHIPCLEEYLSWQRETIPNSSKSKKTVIG